jgi:hypothetical protein
MTVTREQIMTALFAVVSASPAFVTKSRRLQLWDTVSANNKPAIFMYERDDFYKGADRYLPPTVTMSVDLFIYTAPGTDSGITPISILNPLIDAIDAALKPGLNGRQTLGGLVSHCYIDGKIMKDPGDIDGDGIAVIPVKILATA